MRPAGWPAPSGCRERAGRHVLGPVGHPVPLPGDVMAPSGIRFERQETYPCWWRGLAPVSSYPKPPIGRSMQQGAAEDLTRRVAAFEARINQDPCRIADRLWIKLHLDQSEEKLRFSK